MLKSYEIKKRKTNKKELNMYYEKKEGGRIIGNLSHWIDLCIHILGVNNIYTYEINPMYTDKYEDVVYFSINFKKYNSLAMIKFNAKKNDLLGVRENIEFNGVYALSIK